MKKNILIAVTVIISIGLLVWGIEFLKGINLFKPSNHYYVKFEKVDGLNNAAPVTINGFAVGQVRELSYDYESHKISVLLNMNRDLKIPQGTLAYINSSITGTASIELVISDSKEMLEVGGEIQGINESGMMDQLSDKVLPGIVNILPKVDSIMSSINSLVGDPALAASVQRLDIITAQLAESSKRLTALMNSLNQNVPGVMGNVNEIACNLNTTSSNLNEFTGNLNKMPLDSTINNLNTTIANLQAATNKLNDKNSSIGLLLNDKALYNNANHTIQSLDSLFVDIKKNPKRYLTVKIF